MHAATKGSTTMSRPLTIPSAYTHLYAVDTPGGTPALLFLNGSFGTVRNWDRVIQRLAGKYRAVRYDTRARGKSGTSADYSVQGAGLVRSDGAAPMATVDEEGEAKGRTQVRRLEWIMRNLAALGRAARM